MKLKKPKFWDNKTPGILSYLLLPFTFPLIINNFFLNFKKNKSIKQKTINICIGNIYVGGTAKTPLTIKIYEILKNLNFKTATIKKFYKDQIDEQKILAKKTKLYCFKKRKKALEEAIDNNIDVLIFDDGLQDHSMSYDLRFVCFNNKKWIGNSFLLPAGPLREKFGSVSKYDAAFINGNEKDNSELKLLLKEQNKKIQVFETFYKPLNIDEFNIKDKYIIFSGIGNPETFKELLLINKFNIIKEIIFPDHYEYTQHDIDKIKLMAKKLNAKILTTQKDYIKINPINNNEIKFLEIELNIKDQDKLIDYLKSKI